MFGPICPIYGSCVVVVNLLFQNVGALSNPEFPAWGIFLICMIGSAIAEYCTSWVLEKRFHARWWDYSNMPFNLHGRIALPASIGFGLAGVVIVKYLIPAVSGMHSSWNPLVYEGLALIMAVLFGADFALTEASLNALLQSVEEYKAELNRRAELTYENIAGAPKRIENGVVSAKENITDSISQAKENMVESAVQAKVSLVEGAAQAKESLVEGAVQAKESLAKGVSQVKESITEGDRTRSMLELSGHYISRMNHAQKRILDNMKFMPRKGESNEKPAEEYLKAELKRRQDDE